VRDRPPHVLVVYGSERGGTREIADAIAEVLLNEGVDTELADADEVRDLTGYDAAIVGGALYMGRWHADARHFVKQHADELAKMPVWLFSSGPLDDSAEQRELAPARGVVELIEMIGARGHATFGGRLEPDAEGWIAHAMAKTHSGDWRAWHVIRAWAKDVAQQILAEEPRAIRLPAVPRRGPRWLLAALCWFVAVTAIGGGLTLALRPDGSLLDAPPSLLRFSPFASFLIPGLLLLVVVGLGNAAAGVAIARNSRLAPFLALFAGGALFVWIVAEMILLHSDHWLHIAYLTVAAIIVIETWKVFELPWRQRTT
jgi:menaquinone-dependent protoporphyrinogen oxidase